MMPRWGLEDAALGWNGLMGIVPKHRSLTIMLESFFMVSILLTKQQKLGMEQTFSFSSTWKEVEKEQ
jgi:hypothetical protein